MKRVVRLVIKMAFCSIPVFSVYADDLSAVYQQALASDPTFKKANADWLTAKENLPLAMTGNGAPGSGLFPNIAVSGTVGRTYYPNQDRIQSETYVVSMTQPIFNLATWQSIGSAHYSVKAATAQYLAASQDLMSRTAMAYFEVLRANEKLNLTIAQKKQFFIQYQTMKSKYEVGLVAVTPLYDAEAKYDQSIAQEIKDRNNLQNNLENLRAITGKEYQSLASLNAKIPLAIPSPKNMNQWVATAEKQNYLIQSDLNLMYSSKKNISVAKAGYLPTLNLVGSYQNGMTNLSGPVSQSTPDIEQTQVGLNLTFPIFRGGYDGVNTKQARYKYLAASDQLEMDHRQVVTNTQKAFLGVASGISQITADQQAIISAKKQLDATQQGFEVGTRTMEDVLDSVTGLTTVQQQYADDRYNYIDNIINLKQQAGTLSPEDIAMINTWLGKEITFSFQP
ncbi:MAG: hypothetical protein A3F10_07270 [Coxiella sp. RIFCSPHIGHO2_12_FULL_42_15]|nr:MAG: hypothetical protein A3F10_07270 [Coxiella sp. RIFCSPHIGHO2_12_FULL_42_15]